MIITYRLSCPSFTCEVKVKDSKIIHAAPILRKYIGKDLLYVIDRLKIDQVLIIGEEDEEGNYYPNQEIKDKENK